MNNIEIQQTLYAFDRWFWFMRAPAKGTGYIFRELVAEYLSWLNAQESHEEVFPTLGMTYPDSRFDKDQ